MGGAGTAAAAANGSTLHGGQALEIGQALHSDDGAYSAVMQTDGNFVVYDAGQGALWASGTADSGGTRLVMQDDGNLVVYTAEGRAVWDTGTGGSGVYAVMQTDGNFVLYARDRPLWSSYGGLLEPPVLERGDEGPAVAELQRRLEELRFWVGATDGVFGWLTEQAVYAFEKANGITADGKVDSHVRAALDRPSVPSPQSTQGRVIEIDKTRQLLYAVLDGQLEWVFHTSTGTEQPYQHPAGYTAMADTPPGRHTVDWQVDGWRDGRLGRMYRPKYFHSDGIALHGYHAIPPHPASHGCARVTFDAMDFIWAHDLMPIGSVVLVYGTSPPPGPAV